MYTNTDIRYLSPDFTPGSVTVCKIYNLTSWHLTDFPFGNGQVWDPTRWKNNLVQIKDHDPSTGEPKTITDYKGRWGVVGMNNRGVQQPAEWGYDTNNGKDIIPYVSDGGFAACFYALQTAGNVFWEITGFISTYNPIGRFDSIGVESDKLSGSGTDWFSQAHASG